MARPSGAVTLLFTDIEGSTRLWEQDGRAMGLALARHDALVRGEIEAAGGHVFKTMGDAFCAVFGDAMNAVAAVVAAQRAVEKEPWPSASPIRVRMAVHSGVCVEREGDYFGPVVNRAARLLAVGHGGQILLSGATFEQVGAQLEPDWRVQDLGVHRLKDLSQPERIFELTAPGLGDGFEALRSLDDPRVRHNLPVQVSSFVGRAAEVATLRRVIGEGARLVTLTGAGGVGKTRLALQVAAELVDGTGDGVWLVELAPLSDPDLVVRTVAGVLQVRDQAQCPIVDSVIDVVGERYLMLVLDNAEHLVDVTAKLADVLLRSCPRVSLLVTSREPLGIAGEHVFRVPPLSVPPARSVSPDQLAGYESVQLFVERASRQRPGFALEGPDAAAAGAVCARLDGIPLAIELAAARLGSMSVSEINDRLDRRFHILTAGNRSALPRHQTLRALIDWSFELLNRDEKRVLGCLSVFVGGWTLQAAETVCAGGGIEDWQVFPLLSALVDKSLVQADQNDGSTRYRLLETVRHYAGERLVEEGNAHVGAVRMAHRDCYLALAEAAAPELHGPDQVAWLDRIEIEYDNVRAALALCIAEPGAGGLGLRLALALQWFWEVRARYAEGVTAFEALLALPVAATANLDRARALNAACHVGARLGTTPASAARADEALRIAVSFSDDAIAADALYHLYWHHITHSEPARALARAEQGLLAARASRQPRLIARHLMARATARGESATQATAAHDRDDAVRAMLDDTRADFQEALAISRAAGDHERVVAILTNATESELGAGVLGDREAARAGLEEAVTLAGHTGNPDLLTFVITNLASLALGDGEYGRARDLFTEGLVECFHTGRRQYMPELLLGLAIVAHTTGHPTRAAALHGAADELIAQSGREYFAIDALERQNGRERLREQMGDEALAAAIARGRAMTLADAVTLAISDPAGTTATHDDGYT